MAATQRRQARFGAEHGRCARAWAAASGRKARGQGRPRPFGSILAAVAAAACRSSRDGPLKQTANEFDLKTMKTTVRFRQTRPCCRWIRNPFETGRRPKATSESETFGRLVVTRIRGEQEDETALTQANGQRTGIVNRLNLCCRLHLCPSVKF